MHKIYLKIIWKTILNIERIFIIDFWGINLNKYL